MSEDPIQIECALINFYKDLLPRKPSREAWFTNWKGKTISNDKAIWFRKGVTLDELKRQLSTSQRIKPSVPMVSQYYFFKNVRISLKKIY